MTEQLYEKKCTKECFLWEIDHLACNGCPDNPESEES